MDRTAVGIIGTGKHGSRYANHIAGDVDGLELAAIARRSALGRDQAATWGCTWHPRWQDLVADPRVEAVIAVVPPMLNLEIARHCVQHGKPLLMEKPLAGTAADARVIVELFDRCEVPLTVGHTLRYNPVIQSFKAQVPTIGRLFSFSANQRIEPSTLDWHEDASLAGAGVSIHTAVHVFDALRYITGLEIRRVMALTRNHQNRHLEDLLAVLVEMEDGVVGTLDCSKVGHARSGRFEFIGHQGTLCGDQIYGSCEKITHTSLTPVPVTGEPATIVPLLGQWVDFLRGIGPNPITGRDGLAAVLASQACLESAQRGAWVEVA